MLSCKKEPVEISSTRDLYLGTYTQGASEGIYRYSFDTLSGELDNRQLVAKAEHPSFLALSVKTDRLYAVHETNSFEGGSGSVSTFDLGQDRDSSFIALGTVSSHGGHPCHIAVDQDVKYLVVSNYSGGTVSVHRIDGIGLVEPAFQVLDHKLIGEGSHAHSAQFFNDGLFVADLGLNSLFQYVFAPEDKKYVLVHRYGLGEGSGPRHFKIADEGRFIYVINELNSTVAVLERDGGAYTIIQTISTLSKDFDGESFCADLHLSRDGRFVYGSNRGENSIAVFQRNDITGRLRLIQTESTRGDWPRNFVLSPSGKFLLAANQRSEDISVFRVDKESGTLTFLHQEKAPSPVCLLFTDDQEL
jgi:6-phosphogluconolactonase